MSADFEWLRGSLEQHSTVSGLEFRPNGVDVHFADGGLETVAFVQAATVDSHSASRALHAVPDAAFLTAVSRDARIDGDVIQSCLGRGMGWGSVSDLKRALNASRLAGYVWREFAFVEGQLSRLGVVSGIDIVSNRTFDVTVTNGSAVRVCFEPLYQPTAAIYAEAADRFGPFGAYLVTNPYSDPTIDCVEAARSDQVTVLKLSELAQYLRAL